MRIGVDVRELQRGRRTGIGRVVEAFLEGAPRQRPSVELVLYGDPGTELPAGARGHAFRRLTAPSTLWYDQVDLPRALALDGVDVFYSPYYKAPLRSHCPRVVTIHDLLFLEVPEHRRRRRVDDALFVPWARLIASRATAILTDSEHSRADIRRLLGIREEAVRVVPLGVSRTFSPEARRSPETLARDLGVPASYVLSVTNFRSHKNDAVTIRALARAAARHPDLHLVLAGRPSLASERLRGLAGALGVADRVTFVGTVSDADLPALYAGARAFAFPSRYEGFGLPVLEAMASGVPSVCSSATSVPEVAGDAAILVPPDDVGAWASALELLWTDPEVRARLSAAGLARAGRFSWRRTVSGILDVLDRAARTGSAERSVEPVEALGRR